MLWKKMVKRWICTIMALILFMSNFTSTETVWADIFFVDEVNRTANASLNDTFPTIDGGTVSLRGDTSKDVTVLIFGQTVCSNTEILLQSISKSGWIHETNVKVIFAESSKANEAVTRHFIKKNGCDEMAACYSVTGGISEIMWNYIGAGSMSLPVAILFDREGNVREILKGCYSANDLYQAMRKFAEVNGSESDAKIDCLRTLTVNGEENYEEAERVFKLINQARALEGAGVVELDHELMETAMIRAAELSLYYAHVRPSGEDCFTIFRSSARKGENIAVGSKTAQDVMDGWMKSEGHHANIVETAFTSVGIGCFTDNNGTKYWVQCFDSEKAIEPEKYGVHKVQRRVQILESHIHMEAVNQVLTVDCADQAENVKIIIQNRNEIFKDSFPEIQFSDLAYSSSDSRVAEADEHGTVIVNAPGSTVITAALKEAPDINVKIHVTKKEHSYVKVSGQTGTGNEKYVCENCGSGSEASAGKAEIDANISVTKDKSMIKIIDARTKKPISLARIWVSGELWTDKNGTVKLSQTGMTTIQVEKGGYHKKTVKKELNKERTTTIMLSPNTGDLQIVSAVLNLAGEDKDVLDHTFTVFDKDLDGDTNVTAADFTLHIESAGSPVKYELIQNGRVLKTSTDGRFILSGHYSNNKTGTVSYYLDELSAGYGVTVRIFDNRGKYLTKKLGIKVAKASSAVLKKIKRMGSKGKVDLKDKLTVTVPDNIPLLGGTDLEFGFEDKIPIQVYFDSDTGLVRVGLNMSHDKADLAAWYDMKQEFKNLKNRAKSLRNMSLFGGVPESFGAGMFAAEASITGYGEGYLLDNSDSLDINVGVIINLKAEKKFTQYHFVPIGIFTFPVYITFGGGASLYASGEMGFTFADAGMEKNGGSLELKLSTYINPEAGIGVDGISSIGFCGTLDLSCLHRFEDNYNYVSLNGNAKIKGTLLGMTGKWDLCDGTWVIYDSNKKRSSYTGQMIRLNANNIDMSGAKPISMEYLKKRTTTDHISRFASFSEKADFQDSVRVLDYAYEGASPKLIHVGNKLYLFYLDGVKGRKKQDQSALFYQMSSDDGATWSEAVRADNGVNETADYNFDVAVNGDEIYAIWSDAGKVYEDEMLSMDANEVIAKIGKELDIMMSIIDGSTGTVRKTYSFGTEKADLQPNISVGNDGTVYAAWVTNDVSSEYGLLSNENQMGAGYASSKDNYTVQEYIFQKGFYPLSLDTGMLGQDMCIAVSLDTDADLNTQEDREIYSMNLSAGENMKARTSNNKIDSVPVFGKIAGENCLFWYQNGNIAYTSDKEQIKFVFGEENDNSIGQEFSLLESENGNAAIVWESASLTKDAGVDAYCIDFDGNKWSNTYRMGELDSEYTGSVSGYLDGDAYRMVYLGSTYEKDELFSHIYMYNPEERIDTSISWEAKENGTPGETYPLNITVENSGNKTIESLSIVSEDGSIQDEITGISMEPGTSLDIVWEGIHLPAEMTEVYKTNLTVKADGESDTADNKISLSVGAPDFSVEVYQDFSEGEQLAGAVITNNGMVSSDAVLTVYKDERHAEKLYETRMEQMQEGETRIALLDLTMLSPETPVFYFVVSDAGNTETYKEDNQTVLYIARGIYLDYENDSKTGEEKQESNTSGNTAEKISVPMIKSFKAKAGKKKLKLSWKKLSGVSGYQIQISTKKNFKKAKTIFVSGSRKSYTKKKLKAKKKYYIRIRAYKTYKNVQEKDLKSYGKWKTISRKTK